MAPETRMVAGFWVPFPLSWRVAGNKEALVPICSAAARVPSASDVKETKRLQEALTAIGPRQVFVWEKSPGFVPERATEEIRRVAFPVFVSVTG